MDPLFVGAMLVVLPFLGCYLALVLYCTSQGDTANTQQPDLPPLPWLSRRK